MRSLHYLNGGTLSPFPAEPEHCGRRDPVFSGGPETGVTFSADCFIAVRRPKDDRRGRRAGRREPRTARSGQRGVKGCVSTMLPFVEVYRSRMVNKSPTGLRRAPTKAQDRRVAVGIQLNKTREFKLEIPVEVHHVYSISSWRGGGSILCVACVRASRPRRSLGRLFYGEQSRDRVVARPGEEREIGVDRQYGPSLRKHDRPCRDGCGGKRQVREICCRRTPDGPIRSDLGLGWKDEGDDLQPAGLAAGRIQAHGRGKGGTDPGEPGGVEGTGRRLGRLDRIAQRRVPAGIPFQESTGPHGRGDPRPKQRPKSVG